MTTAASLLPGLPDDITVRDIEVAAAAASFYEYLRYCRTSEGEFPLDWPYVKNLANALTMPFDFVILKRRQILTSWLLSAYADWVARQHAGWNVGITSIGEEDAKEFIEKTKLTTDDGRILPKDIGCASTIGILDGKYRNGSKVKAFPSTDHGGVGYTLSDFIMDEAAKHKWGRENYASVYPALYKQRPEVKRRRGRIIIASTSHPADGRAGFFYDEWCKACKSSVPEEWDKAAWWPEREPLSAWLLRRKDQKGKGLTVVPVFLSRWCRPDQPKEGKGSSWVAREKERMATADEEYGGSAAFDVYYPETPAMAFQGREGLVYGRDRSDGQLYFDPKRNIVPAPMLWEQCNWRIIGIDPGGRDPAGIVGLGIYRLTGPLAPGQIPHYRYQRHVYRAISKKGSMSIDDIERLYWQWNKEVGITRVYVGETGGDTIVKTLVARGIPAEQARMDRSQITQMQTLLKSGLMTIEPGEVARLIADQASRYRWKDSGNAFATTGGNQIDHFDVLDGWRYATVSSTAALPASGPAPVAVPGQVGRGSVTAGQVGRGGFAPSQVGRGRSPFSRQVGR